MNEGLEFIRFNHEPIDGVLCHIPKGTTIIDFGVDDDYNHGIWCKIDKYTKN